MVCNRSVTAFSQELVAKRWNGWGYVNAFAYTVVNDRNEWNNAYNYAIKPVHFKDLSLRW